MPYYNAGDYYRAGDNYAAGSLGGFLKKAGKAALGVARTVVSGTPVGRVVEAIAPAPTQMGGRPLQPVAGVTGVMQRIVPGGESGFKLGGGSRRMNAGNAKAARRAIRRIKSVRNLLQSIERELPRRPAPRGGSRGVITRSEAARALRS